MPKVLIPKTYERARSLIAIPKKEYEAFLAYQHESLVAIPKAQYREFITYKKEREEVLAMIAEAEAEYRAGKTTRITSADQLRTL